MSRAVLVLLALLAGLGSRADAQRGDKYDDTFRKYTKRFFGVGFDWRRFKAQGLAESNLDAAAASRVGARGLMQLMPSTFQEIQTRNPGWHSIDDPEFNIAAGIWYDRQLWKLWGDEVDEHERHRFMFGSYNAGRVPILRAQGLATERLLSPRIWASVAEVAPAVRGWRHRETLGYIVRIEEYLDRMDDRGRVIRPDP